MTYLVLMVLSWCLICSAARAPRRQSFRVYDSDGISSLYKGPENYNHDGKTLSSYIVTSKPAGEPKENVEPLYMGSKKPIWEDDPSINYYARDYDDYNDYQSNPEYLKYHDLECDFGPSHLCSQIIDIDEPVISPAKKKHQQGNKMPSVYLEDLDNTIDTNENPYEKYEYEFANKFETKPLDYQLTPHKNNNAEKVVNQSYKTSSPYTASNHKSHLGSKLRYDPFSYQKDLKYKRQSHVPYLHKDSITPYETKSATLYQEPPAYHSHYTDSRLFAPSSPSVPNIRTYKQRASPTSQRRMSSFTPSFISAAAPIMRNSITWKSNHHRDKHIMTNRIGSANTINKNNNFVKTNDYNDYDWNLGWDDSKIDRRQAYLSMSTPQQYNPYEQPANQSPYPSRTSSYYFPAASSGGYRPYIETTTARPYYGTTTSTTGPISENRRNYFPINNNDRPNKPYNVNKKMKPATSINNDDWYDRYNHEEEPFIITKDEEGFLEIEPAVVNTGYVVSDKIQPSDIDDMWSSYDERYGWDEVTTTKRPDPYDTPSIKEQFKAGNAAAIETWTSLDIAKPEWERNPEKYESIDKPNKFQNSQDIKDHNAPYGRWDTPLELDSVPFSRSSDGKPIRWKLLTTTSTVKGGIPAKGSKEAIASPAIPFVVINRQSVEKENYSKIASNQKKHIKNRRISKRIRNKVRKRKIQD